MKTKEINDRVAKFLKDNFKTYSVNKAKRTAKLIVNDVVYTIGYYISGSLREGKYYISFHLSARFLPICDLYDKIFNDDTLPKYDFIHKGLDKWGKTIISLEDLESYLESNLIHINKENEDLLKLQFPIDFLEESAKDDSWGDIFAMKRIMLCKLYLPHKTDEIHSINIKKVSKENDDFHLNGYIKKLKQWEEYHANQKL